MPLTKKGVKIKKSMEKEYGEEKGKKVFYASENKGTIKGVAKHEEMKEMRSKAAHMMARKEMMKKK